MCLDCEDLGRTCPACLEEWRNQRSYAEEVRYQMRLDDIADRHDLGMLERMLEV